MSKSERRRSFGALRAFLLSALCLGVLPGRALADSGHSFVVLREHGAGAAARAQPYLDQLLKAVAKTSGWPNATGQYFADRARALEFIKGQRPEFGILSLDAYLALRAPHQLSVIGEVIAPKAGGLRYHLVSTKASDLAGCRGQKLATTFVSDPSFVERVVARGAFKWADFEIVQAQRPLQPLKQVSRGEAQCALIDDAQFEAAKHIEEGKQLKSVWQSAKLPGMAVVAFPKASGASIQALKAGLANVCAAAADACSSVGIEQLRPATDATYRPVIDAYAK
ncbi:MAG TPA: PhnD/SsuA/transferrin family substrate-binding protein [Polyangiaceae bacterium]|nr:PhnD/SsuA/transferrin family substrate-binding protein [Polyangiaceae bacterium]